jgi:hypothetical protein
MAFFFSELEKEPTTTPKYPPSYEDPAKNTGQAGGGRRQKGTKVFKMRPLLPGSTVLCDNSFEISAGWLA